MSSSPARFIGIDWGSTNARAYLFDTAGTIIDRRSSARGIKHVEPGTHRAVFAEMVAPWHTQFGELPAFLSGMIGSRHGWHEVPYLPCPASLRDLAGALFPVPESPQVRIVPGLRTSGERPDVMRGEELQVLGLGSAAAGCDLVCIPGTHAKWIETDGRVVRDFRTAMTGELFAAVTEYTLFASLIHPGNASFDESAFCSGLDSSAPPHGLLHTLFELRAGTLLGQVRATALPDLLSGLLIGTEIRHQLPHTQPGARIALLGAHALADRYAAALRRFGFVPVAFDLETVTTRGFAELYRLRSVPR